MSEKFTVHPRILKLVNDNTVGAGEAKAILKHYEDHGSLPHSFRRKFYDEVFLAENKWAEGVCPQPHLL